MQISHISPPPAPWDRKEHLFSALHLGTELGTSIYAVAKFISFLEKVFPSLPFNCISVAHLEESFLLSPVFCSEIDVCKDVAH